MSPSQTRVHSVCLFPEPILGKMGKEGIFDTPLSVLSLGTHLSKLLIFLFLSRTYQAYPFQKYTKTRLWIFSYIIFLLHYLLLCSFIHSLISNLTYIFFKPYHVLTNVPGTGYKLVDKTCFCVFEY